MTIETIGRDPKLTLTIIKMVQARENKKLKQQQRKNKLKCLLEKVIRPDWLIKKFTVKTTTTSFEKL